ncbi:uncharacterized protein TNCV_820561 [Trichonephila clavipes]|nr:uncharacterized protein TNCV_820561 [Trichonephila clavipes]
MDFPPIGGSFSIENIEKVELQSENVRHVLDQFEKERKDCTFSRNCLFCRKHFTGNRSVLLNHLMEQHNFLIGAPDNIVFINELLDHLEKMLKEKIHQLGQGRTHNLRYRRPVTNQLGHPAGIFLWQPNYCIEAPMIVHPTVLVSSRLTFVYDTGCQHVHNASFRDKLQEQQSAIRFLTAEGENLAAIHRRMVTVYGEKCVSDKSVRKWSARFRADLESVVDDQARQTLSSRAIASTSWTT